MLIDPKDALRSAARYLQQHPDVLKKVARNARGYKLTIPLDALRYVAKQAEGKKNAPRDMVFEATPPGLSLGGLVSVMGATLKFGAKLQIDDVHVSRSELRFVLKLANVKVTAEGDSNSPVAGLIKSGVLDLSKPGNIARYMPNRPPFIVEAEDDRVKIDLLRDDKIAKNPKVERVLSLLTPVLGVRHIGTEGDALVIELVPRREGLGELAGRARAALREALS